MEAKILRISRSLTTLGLLLAFLGFFLSWFADGASLLTLYYQNGSFSTAALTSTSNQFLTLLYILYPLGLAIAVWSVWKRQETPWQALLIAPALIWMYYEFQGGLQTTGGPLLVLFGGISLPAGYIISRRLGRGENGGTRYEERRSSPGGRYPSRTFGGWWQTRRVSRPFWLIFLLWIILTLGFAAASVSMSYAWYIPDFFGVIAGGWVGYQYYFRVARIGDRAVLFLVVFGSLALIFILANVLLLPYANATSAFNQFFGIQYSASAIGFSSSLASFGTPLIIGIGFAMLFGAWKGSRTIFVRYD